MLKIVTWPYRTLFSFLIDNIFSKTSLVLAIIVAIFFGLQLFTFAKASKSGVSKGIGGNAKDVVIEGNNLYVIDEGIKKHDWTDIMARTDPAIWEIDKNSLEFQRIITKDDSELKDIQRL